jgi:hypothetical protein
MPNVLVYKARALKPQTRAAVKAELGRSLRDDEDVSVMAFGTQEAPASGARLRAAKKLESNFKKNDRSAGVHAASSTEAAPSATRRRVPLGHYRGRAE